MNNITQKGAILEHLKSGRPLTSVQAYDLYGATRLAAVVHELRKHHDIKTVRVHGVNRFGESCSYARYVYKGELDESISD